VILRPLSALVPRFCVRCPWSFFCSCLASSVSRQ
jgi:hypothetical protein